MFCNWGLGPWKVRGENWPWFGEKVETLAGIGQILVDFRQVGVAVSGGVGREVEIEGD